jgi:hypothetical protein
MRWQICTPTGARHITTRMRKFAMRERISDYDQVRTTIVESVLV